MSLAFFLLTYYVNAMEITRDNIYGNHTALWDVLSIAAHTPTHQPTTYPRAKQQIINGVYVEQ